MTPENYSKIGLWTAFGSFLIGTIFFALYFFTYDTNILLFGYFYIIFAGLANLVILPFVWLRGKNFIPSLTMLLNIPIAAIYIISTIGLLNTMKITFTNCTGADIKNIEITGCENKLIYELKQGENKTLDINIPNDCSLKITYLLNNQLKEETVIGYTTTNSGGRIKYNIGGENDLSL